VKLPDQISLILGNKVQLIPEVSGLALSYFWSPGAQLDDIYKQNPWCSATDDITYSLKVSGKGGCSASDDVFILVLKPPEMPNAFSPNGDGINDFWLIKHINRYPDASIDVFDRYNQKVFHSDNYSTPWDGKFNQKPLPVGTYYFVINPKNGLNIMSGSVTIIN
jgi:gliding motility-associated-like protein